VARLALLFLAVAFTLTTACDRGVPSKEQVEGGTAPQTAAAPAAPSVPAQVNTLPTAPSPPMAMMNPKMHPAQGSEPPAETVVAGSIQPAEGGLTVRDIFAKRTDLSGKSVTVRGKVVKAMQGVMGTNWYHIEDGTGDAGTNDLAVTSDGLAKIGDVVLVSGTLTANKDLGMGYHYDAIIEKAKVKVESSEAPAAKEAAPTPAPSAPAAPAAPKG